MKSKHTTISIAHRLSTIKRSDTIIVLSSDGTVAEQGTYKDLSNRPDGAFTKLMEWQMSGGDADGNGNGHHHEMAIAAEGRGPPTEKEYFAHLHEDVPVEQGAELVEGEAAAEGAVKKVEKAEKAEKADKETK